MCILFICLFSWTSIPYKEYSDLLQTHINMINVIIVDDEPLAQDIVETFVTQVPQFNLVAKCSNALEANEVLRKNDIDLMFLDIQMPQITGIEFVKTLKNPPEIVFTTAYSNFAVEGFELNALDYLVKPISMERFLKTANKAIEKIEAENTNVVAPDTSKKEEYFFVKADKKLVKVNFDDIVYIEGLKDYVIIRMEANRVITLQTMKSLESKLPEDKFKRIHRSYIVNLDQINAVEGHMVEVLEKGQAKHLPIGKSYRDSLLKMINKNKL